MLTPRAASSVGCASESDFVLFRHERMTDIALSSQNGEDRKIPLTIFPASASGQQLTAHIEERHIEAGRALAKMTPAEVFQYRQHHRGR
jgi:hypothetical protein